MGWASAEFDTSQPTAYALPAMVIKPTADSGLESVLAVKTVETA